MNRFARTGSALLLVVGIGVFSRTSAGRLPWLDKEFGDTLWATMFYLLIVLLLPRVKTAVAVWMTIAITFAIEFFKLYHAPWIDSLRSRRVPGMLLGHTFYWHDFVSYILGTALGILMDRYLIARKHEA
jgi:hypothetical protein